MRRLQSKLHNTVVKLEQEKFNSTKTLMVLQDKVQEYQREVEDSKPMLSRYLFIPQINRIISHTHSHFIYTSSSTFAVQWRFPFSLGGWGLIIYMTKNTQIKRHWVVKFMCEMRQETRNATL